MKTIKNNKQNKTIKIKINFKIMKYILIVLLLDKKMIKFIRILKANYNKSNKKWINLNLKTNNKVIIKYKEDKY